MRFSVLVLLMMLVAWSGFAAGKDAFETSGLDEVVLAGTMWECWDDIHDIHVAEDGSHRYVAIATGKSGMYIYRHYSTRLEYQAHVPDIGDVQGVYAYEGFNTEDLIIFAFSGEDGVYVIDAATPTSPSVVFNFDTAGEAIDGHVPLRPDRLLYVADGEGGFLVLTWSEYSMELSLESTNMGAGDVYNVFSAFDYAWVQASEYTIAAYNVTNPDDPFMEETYGQGYDGYSTMSTYNTYYSQDGRVFFMHVIPDNGEIYGDGHVDLGTEESFAVVRGQDVDYKYVSAEDGLHIMYREYNSDPSYIGMIEELAYTSQFSVLNYPQDPNLVLSLSPAGVCELDGSGDPEAPVITNLFDPIGGTVSMDIAGDLMATAHDWDGVLLTNISDTENPEVLSHLDIRDARQVELFNDRLYAFTNDSMFIYDLTDLTAPEQITAMEVNMFYTGPQIVMNEDRMISNNGSRMHVYDMADPDNPTFLYDMETPTGSMNWFALPTLDGTLLYTGESFSQEDTYSYYKYDVSGTTEATLLGQFDVTTPDGEFRVSSVRTIIHGDTMISAQQSSYYQPTSEVVVYDISDFEDPTEIGSVEIENHVGKYMVQWSNLIAMGGSRDDYSQSGITIVDVSDPTNPVQVGHDPDLLAQDAAFHGWDELISADLIQVNIWDVSGDMDLESQEADLPDEFALANIYPNPFNPTLNVQVALPQAANLRVGVFNVMGQQVATLADGRMEAGLHTLTFDGSEMASGVYFVRASVPGSLNSVRKVILMK